MKRNVIRIGKHNHWERVYVLKQERTRKVRNTAKKPGKVPK